MEETPDLNSSPVPPGTLKGAQIFLSKLQSLLEGKIHSVWLSVRPEDNEALVLGIAYYYGSDTTMMEIVLRGDEVEPESLDVYCQMVARDANMQMGKVRKQVEVKVSDIHSWRDLDLNTWSR